MIKNKLKTTKIINPGEELEMGLEKIFTKKKGVTDMHKCLMNCCC